MATASSKDFMRSPAPNMTNAPTNATNEAVAVLCKAAADPLRTAIVRALAKDSFGVQELAKVFEMPQPGMSHHLKILATAGLLTPRRQGNSIFYRRVLLTGDGPLDQFLEALFRAIDASPVPDDTLKRIERIHEERSAQSRLFFEKNVARFTEHQGQLCEWNEYASNLIGLIKLIPDHQGKTVLEVGPGQGQLLRELISLFSATFAIDNSEKMLELTREKLGKGAEHVTFAVASLEDAQRALANHFGKSKDAKLDAVVLNMVLHHMPSPAATFRKLSELVSDHGFVVVADLHAHDQDWARETCGDIWLGFNPDEVQSWAEAAGFKEMNSEYLGLRNGFQIQIKLFQLRSD